MRTAVNGNPKLFEVHIRRLDNERIEIQTAYTGSYDSLADRDVITGQIVIGESDYESLLKALNKGRKYVKDHNRNDAVMVPFRLDKR